MTMVTPARGLITVTPQDEPELFWATAGGMGLTGIVLDATIGLHRIETSYLSVDTDRTPDLDTTLDLMESGDHEYDYSVAWIDIMTRGSSLLDRMPATGAVKNMARPETNMVSPIISAS